MDVGILGPLEIRGPEGHEISLPAGRERALLALLVIHRGHVVSNDRILEALWGDRPPGTAPKAVQGYVSHLRRALGPDGGAALLVTQAPGYALRTDSLRVDATRFEALASDARRALEDGAAAEAARLLDEALALWRGPPLAEFAFDDFARAEIDRLEELRLSAKEDRFEALLRLGRHGEIAGQLGSLVAAHPLRERLRGQWMLALYRDGRQADALQAYRDGRRLLAGELGLEPGPELQRLERAILAQDSELEAPAPATLRGAGEAVRRQSGQRFRRAGRRRMVAGGALMLVVAVVLFVYARSRDGASPVTIVPPAVVAVDAATNRVVASIPVGSEPISIASGEGAVWVGDAADGTVTRIDPASRRTQAIGIDAPAIDLAAGGGNVWVATGGFGAIVRIDSRLRRVTARFPLGTPGDPVVPAASAVGVGQGRLWVGAFDGLARLDPRTGRILEKVDLGASPALQIAIGEDDLWATLLTHRARRVEASSGTPTAAFYSGTFALGVALGAGAVWLAGHDVGTLWKLDPVTGSLQTSSRVGDDAHGVAVGAGAVWVASTHDRALVRVDPDSGETVATIPMGGEPQDVVVRDGIVWVAVQAPPPAS